MPCYKLRQTQPVLLAYRGELHPQSAAGFHALDDRFDADLSFGNEEIQLRDRADNAVVGGFEKEAASAEIADARKIFFAGAPPVNADALLQLNSRGRPAGIDGCFGQDSLHPPP